MDFAGLLGVMIGMAALFSYANRRWLGLPRTIGLLVMGLAVSAALVAVGRWLPGLQRTAVSTVAAIDFERLVLHGVLGFLLFAGALHLDVARLWRNRTVIAVLSTVGLVASTVMVGVLTSQVLGLLGMAVPLVVCLLFGALISPTDPIAVIAIVRSLGAPRDLEVQISGESLFNDGFGVVIFLTLLPFVGPTGSAGVTVTGVVALFVRETLGGIVVGAVLGAAGYLLIKSVDDYQVEILLSLALVVAGYPMAEALHVSAPMAMIVAGLLIGNPGRAFAMSATTRERLDTFWEVLDEIVNAVLFVLVGLQLLAITVTARHLAAGMAAIVIALLARWVSTAIPLVVLRRYTRVATPSVVLMTWAGIRGPLCIALALSLHPYLSASAPDTLNVIVVMTYAVVVFSIAVQGLTLKPLLHRLLRKDAVAAR